MKNKEKLKSILTEKQDNKIEQYYLERNTETDTTDKLTKVYNYFTKQLKIEKKEELFTLLGMSAAVLNMILVGFVFCWKFTTLQPRIVNNNIIYLIIVGIGPYIAWVVATDMKFMAYREIKTMWFKALLANTLVTFMQPIYTLTWNLTIKPVFSIKTNPVLTYGMILLLEYVIILIVLTIIICILVNIVKALFSSSELWTKISKFKLSHIRDTRQNIDYKYDLKVIRDLDIGTEINVKENDRFVHIVVNGASGTGKTSSVFTTGIAHDLEVSFRNQQTRHKELLDLIVKGKATLRGPLSEFDEEAVIPVGKTDAEIQKNQEKIDKIKKEYADCGITVIAPNAGVVEDVIRMAAAVHRTVNVMDPMNDYSKYKNVKIIGINPFYIPLGLEESERAIQISSAASVFSDVLIAVNERGGSSDVYFTDIALSVSSNVASIIMLAKNIRGEQADINDVQMCINNFTLLKEYVEEIEKHFGIKAEASSIPQQGSSMAAKKIDQDDINWNKDTTTTTKKVKEKTAQNPYLQQLVFVKTELLGDGAVKMFDQARGLRNQLNKLITDPRVKRMLSANNEQRIDFDKMLSKNQITLVNSAIELSKSVSTAIGLFFILLQKTSVLRRPKDSRSNHFLWIDEASQYMHPAYEDMYALYRQYRVATVMAIQSLSQTEQNPSTAYIKDIMMGAGTHIVFGRLSPEEMELYSKMAGQKMENVEQTSVTQSSIFSANPQYSEGVRVSQQYVNIQEGSDIRLLDFQEVCVFTIDNGRVLEGKLGRVFFVDNAVFKEKKGDVIAWEKVVPEAFQQETPKSIEISEEFKGRVNKQEQVVIEPEIVVTEKIMTQTIVDIPLEKTPKKESIEEQSNKFSELFAPDDEGKEEIPPDEPVQPEDIMEMFKGLFFEKKEDVSTEEDELRKALKEFESR